MTQKISTSWGTKDRSEKEIAEACLTDLIRFYSVDEYKALVIEGLINNAFVMEILSKANRSIIIDKINKFEATIGTTKWVSDDGVYIEKTPDTTLTEIIEEIVKLSKSDTIKYHFAIGHHFSNVTKRTYIIKKLGRNIGSRIMMFQDNKSRFNKHVDPFDTLYISRGYEVTKTNELVKIKSQLPPRYYRTMQGVTDLEDIRIAIAIEFEVSKYIVPKHLITKRLLSKCDYMSYDDVIEHIHEHISFIEGKENTVESRELADLYTHLIKDSFVNCERSDRPYKKAEFYLDVGVIGETSTRVNGKKVKCKILEVK